MSPRPYLDQCLLCIPVFPCETSGDKSVLVWPLLVLPWGWITVYGEECEDTQRNQATQRKPLNAEINFCHRAVISQGTLFKQCSNFVTYSFLSSLV